MIFALLTRRLRLWLLTAVAVPLVGGLLRRIGRLLQRGRRTAALGRGLVAGADFLTSRRDRVRAASGRGRRGRLRRRRQR